MRATRSSGRVDGKAFTLIELLVVIAIIAILAGLLFSGLGGASKSRNKALITARLAEIQTAIDEYHEKKNMYPPSYNNRVDRPTLYYELVGTTYDSKSGKYNTLDGQQSLSLGDAKSFFSSPSGSGPGFTFEGFANSGLKTGEAENFYRSLAKKAHTASPDSSGVDIQLLSVPVKQDRGVDLFWYYDSRSPTNNPGKYDLWVELIQNGKTEIIGNFSR